jgi:prevent-host-death family protein
VSGTGIHDDAGKMRNARRNVMSELSVSASELRERSADLIENVDRGRVLIRKHGVDRAYLISARELRAMEETLVVLENNELMASIKAGLDDMRAGRVRDADDAFAELDAEFRDKE